MKKNDKLISIILPVYKVENYIDKCMETVVNQTYKNLEIILVDDGSPDNCPQKCDEWAKKDKRVKVVHKVNGGVSTARNDGLKIATGDYIGFVDPDDYIDLTMFEKLARSIETNHADMAMCGFAKIKEEGTKLSQVEANLKNINNKNIFEFYLLRNCFVKDGVIYLENIMGCNWRVLYTKQLIKNVRFIEGLILAEDLLFNMQVINENTKISIVDEQLYFYLIRDNSASRTYDEKKILDMIHLAEVMQETTKNLESNTLECAFNFSHHRSIILNIVESKDKALYKKVKSKIKEANLNTKENYLAYNTYTKSRKDRIINYLTYKNRIKTIKFILKLSAIKNKLKNNKQ